LRSCRFAKLFFIYVFASFFVGIQTANGTCAWVDGVDRQQHEAWNICQCDTWCVC